MGSGGGPSIHNIFKTKSYTGNSELVVTDFTLFSLCWVIFSRYESSVSHWFMGNGNAPKL